MKEEERHNYFTSDRLHQKTCSDQILQANWNSFKERNVPLTSVNLPAEHTQSVRCGWTNLCTTSKRTNTAVFSSLYLKRISCTQTMWIKY